MAGGIRCRVGVRLVVTFLKVRSFNNTTVRRYGSFGDFCMAWWIVLGQVFDILRCERLSDANLGVETDGRSLEPSCGSLVLFGQPCSHVLEVSLMLMRVWRMVLLCSDWGFKGTVSERAVRERRGGWDISYGSTCSCIIVANSWISGIVLILIVCLSYT